MICIKEWCISFLDIDGKFHRRCGFCHKDSFAYTSYYIHGKRHNDNGPAVIYSDGSVDYYLNDIKYSKEEYDKIMGVF